MANKIFTGHEFLNPFSKTLLAGRRQIPEILMLLI
jgi:hypothetical protein